MKVDGGCHCGNITYQADIDPDAVFLCHCTDCQTLSGAAFRTVVRISDADFKLLSGALKNYIKTAESGAKRIQAFCPDCATAIYATSVGDGPKFYGLRVATARQRNELPPKANYWFGSAQDWIGNVGSLPVVEKQ